MARRRLSQQQRHRIKKAQQSVNLDDENNYPGTVISHHGGEVEVEPIDQDQPNIACKFRSNLGTLVCGDRVVYQRHKNAPAIISILPRQNLLQRQDGFGQIKAVAANVTQLIICLAVEPAPNLFLLDQYLLSAQQQQVKVLIVLNKADLLGAGDSDPFDLLKIYQPLGYPVLQTSIKSGLNIDRLQQLCIDHTNVISGVSGVGKSSITKAILPQQDIAIGELSEANKEGKHTTRTSRLYHLPLGGQLIDTPGVRGFKPVFEEGLPISAGFVEIEQQAQHCQFSNCRHVNEPKCAVRLAVESGQIQPSRYQHYLKILQENPS